MRPFIQNTGSYFLEGVETNHLPGTDSPNDVIVSGYSYPLTKIQQEMSPQSCDHRQVGILYADIADYSRLTEQDEEGTVARQKAHRSVPCRRMRNLARSENAAQDTGASSKHVLQPQNTLDRLRSDRPRPRMVRSSAQ